jgi:hypothetical protein
MVSIVVFSMRSRADWGEPDDFQPPIGSAGSRSERKLRFGPEPLSIGSRVSHRTGLSMGDATASTEKQREIRFCRLHPDPDPAAGACLLLIDLDAIVAVEKVSDCVVSIAYDLTDISLYEIEETLIELGFHLDNSLTCKLRRALFRYTEENERANLEASPWEQVPNDARDVFVSRYQRLRHGCRDNRPRHWREYL